MSRKTAEAGIKLIKNFEGCRLTAYKAVATEEYYTIGWGHYGADVTKGMTITQAQADSMLVTDLAKYEAYVNNTSYVPVTAQLNQNQFDALVSFCYNCGPVNLQTLCKDRTIQQIAENITKYDKSSGTVLAGLTKRRAAELELYNTETESEEEMTTAEKAAFEALQATVAVQAEAIAALQARLNIDGKQTYASNYAEAITAAKAAGIITTSADKSKLELNIIQMFYNAGISNKDLITFFKNYKA